jgi:hypothetical protein
MEPRMGKIKQTYQDMKGNLHPRPEDATKADLLIVLGSPATANQVFAERERIERIFAEHDEMVAAENKL